MSKKLSFTDAAEKVLRGFGNRKPMHYKNIIDIAVKKGWILTKGLTSETTSQEKKIFIRQLVEGITIDANKSEGILGLYSFPVMGHFGHAEGGI
ncbi:hypothetical protein GTO36_08305 [bacterium]|nr:hypothetical protein [bacterium]